MKSTKCALVDGNPREFELTKRNFISHFSIGQKAPVTTEFTWWETGNQYTSTNKHGGACR